jgi:hypothetical protein
MSRLTVLLSSGITVLGSTFLQKVPLSKIVGASFSFFKLDQALTPLVGLYGGAWPIIIVYVVRTIARMATSPITVAASFHLPAAAASIYLATNSPLIRAGIALSCIVLFLIHPVGGTSWLYAMYWLIPIIIAFLNPAAFFWQAIGSTFTAHAVGSTLWLYSHTTNCHFWHALISIVWLERLCYALCMTAGYYAILYSKKLLSTRRDWQHS